MSAPAARTTAGPTSKEYRQPAYTNPIYSYPHNGRDASITGGFVYHGTQFPSSYQGSYFFADYTQNWIKRMTFDANGNVTGVFNFEPRGRIERRAVRRHRLPDRGPGRRPLLRRHRLLRHRRDLRRQQAPPDQLLERQPSSDRGRGGESDRWAGAARGQLLERGFVGSRRATADVLVDVRRQHDVDDRQSDPHVHSGGPVLGAAVRLGRREHDLLDADLDQRRKPTNGDHPVAAGRNFFVAGDVISSPGSGTDPDDGTLPASAFTWNIDFLHEGHVHPGRQSRGSRAGPSRSRQAATTSAATRAIGSRSPSRTRPD